MIVFETTRVAWYEKWRMNANARRATQSEVQIQKDSRARSDMTGVVAARRNKHFTGSNTSAEHEDHRRLWRSSPTENQLITWKKVCSSPSSFLLISCAQRRLKKIVSSW